MGRSHIDSYFRRDKATPIPGDKVILHCIPDADPSLLASHLLDQEPPVMGNLVCGVADCKQSWVRAHKVGNAKDGLLGHGGPSNQAKLPGYGALLRNPEPNLIPVFMEFEVV